MNGKHKFLTISAGLIALGMVLLTAFQQVSATVANASETALLHQWAAETPRIDQPGQGVPSRWIGATRIYDMHGFRIRALTAGEISAARWMAMAHFYENRGLLNPGSVDDKALADR